MPTLEITIPVAAQWPTSEELAARNAVEDALNVAGIGTFVGAGGGRGVMDLAYHVDDEAKVADAMAAIKEAMKTHMPGFELATTNAPAACDQPYAKKGASVSSGRAQV